MDLFDVSGRDFCGYAEFTQALYKQGLVWVGGLNKDTDAATSNGVGKTTIFKAITWCLFGEVIGKDKGDKVIRHGQRSAEVSTRLKDGDDFWTVKRERRRGTPRLELIQPDGVPWKAGKLDVQSKIHELIGMDFQAFKNTHLYGQNDSARFAAPATRDADRKSMLHRIMRTSVVVDCAERARKRGSALRAEIAADEGAASRLDAKIGEHDIAELEEASANWDESRAERVQDHIDKAKELKGQADGWRKRAATLDTLKAREKQLKDDIADAKASEASAKRLRDEWEGLKASAAKAESVGDVIATKLEAAQAESKRLKGDKCPVCTSPLDSGHAGKHKAEVAARIAKLKKESEGNEAVQNELALAATAKGKEWELANQRSELAGEDAELELEGVRSKISEAATANERADELIVRAKESLEAAKAAKAEESPYAARLKAAQAKVQAYTEEKQALERRIETRSSELAHTEFWVKGFGGQGLPSFILDSVMPFITERANHYLETLADGDITINFSTQRELKSSKGEMRDEIDISWVIEGAPDYDPSGGQLKKMEIATDLALMDLVATREGGHLDILMMDEVLDGLDAEGRSRVLHLLHSLRSSRGTIFVVSHEQDMAEIFERSITVVKEGGIARLESAA